MSKHKKLETESTSSYDADRMRLTIKVTVQAKPADYETLSTEGTIELSCKPEDRDDKYADQEKFLRNATHNTMKKQIRDYDKGVATSLRK